MYSNGDYEKAAHAIDVALQPALEHPYPLSMRFIKKIINFEWAARMLNQAKYSLYGENDTISKTTDSKGDDSNTISDGMNSVKLQPGWLLAKAKFTVAFEEFALNWSEKLARMFFHKEHMIKWKRYLERWKYRLCHLLIAAWKTIPRMFLCSRTFFSRQ